MTHSTYGSRGIRGATLVLSALAILVCLGSGTPPAVAGNFSISPVKFEFEPGRRTGILTVTNESDAELALQVRVFAWRQEAGEDVFTATDDIVYFPRILTVEGNQERIIRLGMKIPPGERERSYRMYLEELPSARDSEGTTVRTLMRVGIPIFLRPREVIGEPAVEEVEVEGQRLGFRLANHRNRYFKYTDIEIAGYDDQGEELHRTTLDGWYLLAGTSKRIVTEVPEEVIEDLTRFEISVRGTGETIVAEHTVP